MQTHPHRIWSKAFLSLAHRRSSRKSANGVALVVVLFAVALVSIVVLAYFNLALLNRNISFSSAGQARANILALSALNFIKGDFIAEIQAGSTEEVDPTGANVPIYVPLTNATMLPYRMTTNIAYNSAIPANLIKWSSGSIPFWTNTASYGSVYGPKRGVSGISTATASVNGRYIGTARWQKPDFTTSSSFPPTTVTPEWVFMTRQGPLTNTATAISTLANPASTNSSYVVGRYAYMVYDEGGLIDITAAGFSSNTFLGSSPTDATDVGRKGSQGFADIGLLGLGLSSAQVEQLGGWRNASSWTSTNAYVGYLTTNAPASGFLQPATGDQTFLSRQDLINYWTNQLGANMGYLTNITTFSREKNAPSWGPEHDANDTTSPTYWNGSNTDVAYDSITLNDPTGGISYAYHTSKDLAASNNRFFPNVRVKAAFTRLSKEQAVVGEPLVKNRFDLSKLAWITYNGTPPTNVGYQDIYNYFGLIPNFNSNGVFLSWTYNHTSTTAPTPVNGTQATDTTSIMTLDQVASANREPDFFELLQAGILRGSLGLNSGDPLQASNGADGGPVNENDAGGEFYRAANPPQPNGALIPVDDAAVCYRPIIADGSAIPHVVYAQSMFQVIQIGANIIDQNTSDNFPTDIILDGENFYGVKNLPYINAIGDAALRPANASSIAIPASGSAITATTTQYQAYVHRWLDFGLWNPHQNAKNPPAVGPTKLRICVAGGQEYPYITGLGNFNPPTTPSPVPGTDYSGRIFEAPGTTFNTSTQGYVDGSAWIEIKLSDYPNLFSDPTAITTAYTSDSDSPLDSATYNMNSPDGITQTQGGWQRSGIYLGWSKSPDNPYKVPQSAPIWPNYAVTNLASLSTMTFFPREPLPYIQERDANMYFNPPLKIYLQYEDTANAGVWHTYEELHNVYTTRGSSTSGDAYMEDTDPSYASWSTAPTYLPVPPSFGTNNSSGITVTKAVWGTSATFSGAFTNTLDTYVFNFLDPRSIRQNMSTQRGQFYTTNGTGITGMVTSTFASTGAVSKGISTGFHFCNPAMPTADAAWPGYASTWVDNVSLPTVLKNYDISTGATTTFYRDRDYIARTADAGGWTNATPLPTGVQMPRPIQLDRPFRSVAELGYVFRDDPWKTLNLISANSADSALMDLFYVGSGTNTATPTVPAPDVIAGKMNINSAVANAVNGPSTNSVVLQSLISQTLRDYQSASGNPYALNSSITSPSDIVTLSANVVSYIKTNGPVMNIADLAGIYPQVPAAIPPTPLYTGLKNPSEALIRALADSTGTRTWNLMIDVVAQAGKFSPSASSLNNFTVEGEKHYWLHVAIDRFTGEIVDQQLEPVWE